MENQAGKGQKQVPDLPRRAGQLPIKEPTGKVNSSVGCQTEEKTGQGSERKCVLGEVRRGITRSHSSGNLGAAKEPGRRERGESGQKSEGTVCLAELRK